MSKKRMQTPISRRTFLRYSAIAGAASFGALAGCVVPTQQVPAGQTQAPATAQPAASDMTTPLHAMSWSYHPEVVQENLQKWAEVYDEPVPTYEQSPSGSVYLDLLMGKFIGGVILDLVYIDEFYANRLYKSNYTHSLDEFPEAEEIKAGIYDVGLQSMTSSDGVLIGLPYWSGPQQLVAHAGHLDEAGLEPPDTWEEFVAQLEEIKGKGISTYPFLPQWVRSASQIDWTLYAECYSDGEYLFDEEARPTFEGGGVALQKTLERWKYLWDNELVPPDVFTVPGEGIAAYATGQYTYHWTHEYDQKVFNDPDQSQLAGMCINFTHPGTEKTTFVDSAHYAMGANTRNPERAWKLLRWFGWRDPNTGEFEVNKRWAIDFGLGTVIKDLAEDPEVVENWQQWKDVDVYYSQMERGRARNEMKQLWYNEWNEFMMSQVQDAITGEQAIGDVINALYDKAVTLRDAYPVL